MNLAVLPAGAVFFAPVLQASLIPPARPLTAVPAAPTVQSTTQAITVQGVPVSGADVPAAQSQASADAAASLAQAKELHTDLWLTFLAITTGLVIGVYAGTRRRL